MLFQNGRVFTGAGKFERVDVRVNGELISEIGEHLPANGEEIVDLGGKKLVPGFIDIHTLGCGG